MSHNVANLTAVATTTQTNEAPALSEAKKKIRRVTIIELGLMAVAVVAAVVVASKLSPAE